MIIHGIFYMAGKVSDGHSWNILHDWKGLMIIHGIFYMTGKVSDDHSWNILHDC